jgi:hypothetical protein
MDGTYRLVGAVVAMAFRAPGYPVRSKARRCASGMPEADVAGVLS